jgi:hypothetical protein
MNLLHETVYNYVSECYIYIVYIYIYIYIYSLLMGIITAVESAQCCLGGTTHILQAFQHCRSGTAFCLRNCLLEVIQCAVIVFIDSFLQVTPQKKKNWRG